MKLKKLKRGNTESSKKEKKTNCRQRKSYLIYRKFHISKIDMGNNRIISYLVERK